MILYSELETKSPEAPALRGQQDIMPDVWMFISYYYPYQHLLLISTNNNRELYT